MALPQKILRLLKKKRNQSNPASLPESKFYEDSSPDSTPGGSPRNRFDGTGTGGSSITQFALAKLRLLRSSSTLFPGDAPSALDEHESMRISCTCDLRTIEQAILESIRDSDQESASA